MNPILKLSASLCVMAISIAGPSFADDHDEIIVTGRTLANEKFSATKTPTLIVNVPQSLSVIPDELIDEQGFVSVADVIQYTPGVSMGQGEGHRDQLTIRGQNTTADFFLDGLRDDVQYFRPLYNIAQIEILRGSNAMIFGRGGGGGVINRVTKKATTDESFNELTVSGNTFGSAYGATDNNIVLGDGSAVRLNAFYEVLDNHRDFFEGNRLAINPTARFDLSNDTHLDLSYEFVDDGRTVDRGVPSLNGAPLTGFNNTFFGDPDANETTLQAHIAKARLDHRLGENLSLNGTLQYADYDKFYQNIYPIGIDLVADQVSLDGYRDTTDRQNLIAQANMIAELDMGGLHHTILVGAEYADQATENGRMDVFFEDSADDQISIAFTDPLAIPAFSFPTYTRNRASDVNVLSVYAQNQVDIGDHVKVIGGLRFDSFDIEVDDIIAGAQFSRQDDEISPRLGLIYKPQENVSIYASYSQSFLPRSGDQFLSLSPTTEALAPEEFLNYELGAKWDINPDLAMTAAVFQLDRERSTIVDPTNPEDTLLITSETKGLEFQLMGHITENWNVSAGYSYLDAPDVGQVPEHMVSLWNRYELGKKLGLGLGLIYQDGQYASSSRTVMLPEFTRVDAALFYHVSEDLDLQLNVENLFDKDYFSAAHNNNNITPAAPLNARVTLRTKF